MRMIAFHRSGFHIIKFFDSPNLKTIKANPFTICKLQTLEFLWEFHQRTGVAYLPFRILNGRLWRPESEVQSQQTKTDSSGLAALLAAGGQHLWQAESPENQNVFCNTTSFILKASRWAGPDWLRRSVPKAGRKLSYLAKHETGSPSC